MSAIEVTPLLGGRTREGPLKVHSAVPALSFQPVFLLLFDKQIRLLRCLGQTVCSRDHLCEFHWNAEMRRFVSHLFDDQMLRTGESLRNSRDQRVIYL